MNRANSSSAFAIHSEWDIDAPISELLPVLSDPRCLADWWHRVFMHIEELCPGDESRRGMIVKCHTKGFLPYALQFVARVEARDGHTILFRMSGDFDGQAKLVAQELSGVTRIFVEWIFELRHPRLRYLSSLLRPIFVWNHYWAMRQGHKGLSQMVHNRRTGVSGRSFGKPTFPHNLAAMQIPTRWRI